MLNTKEIYRVLDEVKSYDSLDYRFGERYDELTELLSVDEDAAIQFIREQQLVENVFHLSCTFEDLALHFMSQKFLDFLKELHLKFPDVPLEQEIDKAGFYLKSYDPVFREAEIIRINKWIDELSHHDPSVKTDNLVRYLNKLLSLRD